ncbi:MAG: hypothetical protein HKM07_05800 [Chlamydiae bacterium]|nr:hypothetical protein [Chlamydiota bacterium]
MQQIDPQAAIERNRALQFLTNQLDVNTGSIRQGRANTVALKALRETREFYETHANTLTTTELTRLRTSLAPYQEVEIREAFRTTITSRMQSIFFRIHASKPKTTRELYACIDERITIRNSCRAFIETPPENPQNIHQGDLLKAYILQNRAEHPRLFFSLQEEINEWKTIAPILNANLLAELEGLHFTEQEIKTGAISPERPNLRDLINEVADGETLVTQDAQVETQTQQLREDRLYRLRNLSLIYQDLFTNSPNIDPATPVALKYFPRTYGWFIGALDVSGQASDSQVEVSMQGIANQHQIRIISDVSPTSYAITHGQLNQTIRLNYKTGRPAQYAQDFVEFSSKDARIPAMRQHPNIQEYNQLLNVMIRERGSRNHLWRRRENENSRNHDIRGTPFEKDRSKKAIALGAAIGSVVSMNLTYSEGGNMLIGEDQNGPYAIIGMDSYAASKYLMEENLGRPLSDDEIKMAFAIDYGIPKDKIYFIEQPGDFHLDMSMSLAGGRKILLNDSVRAYHEFKNHPARIEALRAKGIVSPEQIRAQNNLDLKNAKRRKKFEDQVHTQLRRQGFEVERLAGKFYYESDSQAMNFFNTVTATTPQDQPIVIATACVDADYENKFKNLIRQHFDRAVPEQNITFLGPEESQACFEGSGGIFCRIKTIPLP